MTEAARIPVRDLRNHVSEVLSRVEAGESLEVTVNNRPVAMLVPRPRRSQTLPTNEFLANLRQADPKLHDELAEAFPETTDEMDDPWR